MDLTWGYAMLILFYFYQQIQVFIIAFNVLILNHIQNIMNQ